MTIEEKINKILPKTHVHQIKHWSWRTMPKSVFYKRLQHPVSNYLSEILYEVDSIIEQASVEECLASDCEYVRECKKWYMERE